VALVVDADAHVDESESTWSFIEPSFARFTPRTLDLAPGTAIVRDDPRPHRIWQINGSHLILRRYRDDARTSTTRETRELADVSARLAHMDRLGVDVQVLYPTMFLFSVGAPDVELALYRAYNRWMAQTTASSQGRLRWVALIPFQSAGEAVAELTFAVGHGACGVLKKAFEVGGRPCSDETFFPVYAEAQRLNVPICIHTGSGNPNETDANSSLAALASMVNLVAVSAFTALTLAGVPPKFPTLRFGWIETGAAWIPHLIKDLEAKKARLREVPFDLQRDLLAQYRCYSTCDTLDDFDYLLRHGAEDQLMLGTDYGHADQASEINAHAVLRARADRGEISHELARKILSDNPTRFYGL
jgi:predicted TIM-barrel fold metal-dependent hydrolase